MAIDYRMIVGTKIDGTDIQQQIDKLPVKKIVVQPTVKGSKEIKTMTDDMGNLVTTTTKFNKVGESTGTTLSKVSTNFKDTSNQIETASTHTETLAGKFVDITKKVVAFGAVTSLIGTFTKLMYEAVESVKVMDDSLTELKKVTDLSGGGLENYTDQAFAMARDLKTTASDVTDAVTEFAKSNYTLEESQTLAKQAIVFQTIADGAVSASDSATMLIQVMKAYNMTVSDSVKIVDSINEVSNKYAVSSTDLSSSIGRVASSAKMAGVDFNQLLGLITGSNEIVQNAGKTANGYKTILTNLMTKDLEKQFNEFGLTMREQNGEMKSGYDMLIELGQVYNSLGTTWSEDDEAMISLNDSMNKLMKDIAGAFNINVLSAGFQNVETTIDATESAMNSAGSATDEYAVAMDSISKKTDALKGSFQELVWGDGGLQGLIKGFLDAGTGILKFANDTDMLKVILIDIGVILTATLIPKFMSFLDTMYTTIGVLVLETAQTKSLSAGLQYVGISAGVAQVALVGLTLAVSAGVMAWNAYKSSQEEAKRLAVENAEGFYNQAKSIQSVVDSMKNENASRDDLLDAIDSVNSKYADEIGKLKDVNELRARGIELLQNESKEAIASAQASIASEVTKAKSGISAGTSIDGTSDYEKYLGAPSVTSSEADRVSFEYSDIEAQTNALQKAVEQAKQNVEAGKEEQYVLDGLNKLYNSSKEQLDNYTYYLDLDKKYTDALNESTKEQTSTTGTQSEATSEATQELESLAESLGVSTEQAEKMAESLGISNKELTKVLSNLGLSADELANNSDAMGVSIEQYIEYASAMQDFNDSIDSIQSAYSTLSDAVSEYNETGSYSLDTVQSLLALDGDYLSMLQVVNGQMVLNEEAIRNKVLAQAEEAKQTIYNTAIAELNAIAAGKSSEATKTLSTDKSNSSIDIAKQTTSLSENNYQLAINNTLQAQGQEAQSDVNEVIKRTRASIDAINLAVEGMGSNFAGSMGKASSSTSKANSEVKKLKSTVEDLLKERIQERIDKLKDAQKDEIKIIESQISSVEKLKKAEEKRIEDKISALEKEKDSVSSYYDAEIAKLQKASTELDRNNKLMELQQNLALAQSSKVMVMGESGKFEYQADESAVASAEQDLFQYQQELALQQQIESLQAMKDTAIASIDAQIEKWEEYKTRMSENYQSQIDSLNEYKQTVQDGYDEQIEILENYKDNVEEFVDTLSEEQQRQLKNQLDTIKQTASNYETDLKNLREYVDKYNSILAQKVQFGATVLTSTSVGAKKYASGTSGVSSNEVAFVGDAPNTEMVVGSKANGTLMNLAKGTGVVNAESTKTFAGMLNSLSKNSSISGLTSEIANSSTNNSNTSVVIQNVTLPSVTNAQSFVDELRGFSANMTQYAYSNG